MAISTQMILTEIRRLLRQGIFTSLTTDGVPDIASETESILEQLAFIILLQPTSIFTFFGMEVTRKLKAIDAYLVAVQAAYTDRGLAGLPAVLASTVPETKNLENAEIRIRIYDPAWTGVAPAALAIQKTEDDLTTFATETATNLTTLTKYEARSVLRSGLVDIEAKYAAIDLSSLEDYTESFEQAAFGFLAMQSVLKRIRQSLFDVLNQVADKTDPEIVSSSESLLVSSLTARRLLAILDSVPVVAGSTVVNTRDDFFFPDDDLVLEGETGATYQDLVILDGEPGIPLTVAAEPLSLSDTTTPRVRSQTINFDLEYSVIVSDTPLLTGAGVSGLDLISTNTDVVAVDDGGLLIHLIDTDGLFSVYAVESGDKVYTAEGGHSYMDVDHLGSILVDPVDWNTDLILDVATESPVVGPFVCLFYHPLSPYLVDASANFGESLRGSRVVLPGLGETTFVYRVIDANTLQLADAVLPCAFVPGAAPAGVAVLYEIYSYSSTLGRTVSVVGTSELFSYNLPARTQIKLISPTVNKQVSLVAVTDDAEFIIDDPVPVGSYTALFLYLVRPGDLLLFQGFRYSIVDVLSEDLILVHPSVDSSAIGEAKIIPVNAGRATKKFHDSTVDFVSSGVVPGDLLIVDMDGRKCKSKISAVTTHTLYLGIAIPTEKTGLSYRILRKDDLSTYLVETAAGNLASVVADDVLACTACQPTDVSAPISASQMHVEPGMPVSLDHTVGIVTRGGAEGYAHYALIQDRLFGVTPVVLRDADTYQDRVGQVLSHLDEVGVPYVSGSVDVIDPPYGVISDRLKTTCSLAALRFGDAVRIELPLVAGGTGILVRYVREWLEDDKLISVFPTISTTKYSSLTGPAEISRTASSNALYELSLIEASILEMKEVLEGLVSPQVTSVLAFMDYLSSHGYDRARDLLVSGDLVNLSLATNKQLSYAGRMQELTALAGSLLGEESDIWGVDDLG